MLDESKGVSQTWEKRGYDNAGDSVVRNPHFF